MNVAGRLATVTVTFHPDLPVLRAQLEQLPAGALRIIIDNDSGEAAVAGLRALANEFGATLVCNPVNTGLASATNAGIALACEAGCARILFLDQDTEPGANGVRDLCAAHDRLAAGGAPLACMGPRLVDVASGLEHGFHQVRGWRWVRTCPAPDRDAPLRCASLNGSGTLVPREIVEVVGGLEEDFFIDHVDTEWSFRVLAAGFGLYGAPQVRFRHRMGETTWRFWWMGWRVWPYRSPRRHRYLFRNGARLLRRDYVPAVWKAWAAPKLLVTLVVHALFDHRRGAQIGEMVRGFMEGWRARPRGVER